MNAPGSTLGAFREQRATREWGCAWKRCLRAARVVITSPEGNQWGACSHHVKQVREAMTDD